MHRRGHLLRLRGAPDYGIAPAPPTAVSHGCTPGFWKNHATTPPWGSYTPTQTVGSVFTIPVGIPGAGGLDACASEDVRLAHLAGDDVRQLKKRGLIGRHRNSLPLPLRFDHEHRQKRFAHGSRVSAPSRGRNRHAWAPAKVSAWTLGYDPRASLEARRSFMPLEY